METLSAKTSSKPEFSYKEAEQLKTLRVYVLKLRELATLLGKEFPGDTMALFPVKYAIEEAAKRITALELQKIQAEVKI